MESRVLEVEINVNFASQEVEVVQGDRCAGDEIGFRWSINDQELKLESGNVDLYQSIEQKFPECPVICLVDSK